MPNNYTYLRMGINSKATWQIFGHSWPVGAKSDSA
jgi:hypothetical protein